MYLIEVDDIDPQSREAGIDGLGDDLARQIRPAIANPVAAPRSGDFGGDDQSIAALPLEPTAEKCLGSALGFPVRRHRIHFGAVDEVDPVRDGVIQLMVGIGFGVLLAPGHRTQAYLGNIELGSGKDSKLHRFCSSGHWLGHSSLELYDSGCGWRTLWHNVFSPSCSEGRS
jgi:hypothetical protein